MSTTTTVRIRHLVESDKSIIIATWACLISLTLLIILGCVFYAYCYEPYRQRRVQQNAQDIDRMQANVKIFTQHEQQRRKCYVKRATRKCTMIYNKDSEQKYNSATTDNPRPFEFATGCSICLEPFTYGQAIMFSTNRQQCAHLYHQQCMLTWLVSQQQQQLPSSGNSNNNTAMCPCCRQEFCQYESFTPQSSISSHSQFTSRMGSDDDEDDNDHQQDHTTTTTDIESGL